MYCMKCGKEIPEKQTFCDDCLAEMAKFPVKPGTPVLLPHRSIAAPLKKAASRKKILSLEERLGRAKKAIQWLSIALAVTLFACILSISLLFDSMAAKETGHEIGQNYNTISDSITTD